MNPKWVIGIVTLWLILGLLGGVIENAYLGSDEQSKLNTLMTPLLAESTWDFIGKMVTALITPAWWGALVGMFMFDFAMFTGAMVIFQWILFLPLATGVIISFTLAIIRGVGSS